MTRWRRLTAINELVDGRPFNPDRHHPTRNTPCGPLPPNRTIPKNTRPTTPTTESAYFSPPHPVPTEPRHESLASAALSSGGLSRRTKMCSSPHGQIPEPRAADGGGGGVVDGTAWAKNGASAPGAGPGFVWGRGRSPAGRASQWRAPLWFRGKGVPGTPFISRCTHPEPLYSTQLSNVSGRRFYVPRRRRQTSADDGLLEGSPWLCRVGCV